MRTPENLYRTSFKLAVIWLGGYPLTRDEKDLVKDAVERELPWLYDALEALARSSAFPTSDILEVHRQWVGAIDDLPQMRASARELGKAWPRLTDALDDLLLAVCDEESPSQV